MSLPLELKVFPSIPECPQPDWGSFAYEDWFTDRAAERNLSKKKRLTDAELAAEMQGAVFHEAECEVRGLRLELRNPGHPAVDHWAHWNHEFGRRAMILERFATLPHYDEPEGK